MNGFYEPNFNFGGQYYGYNNQPQAGMHRVKNLLSNEEINMLRQKVEQFNLNLTPEEQMKGKCNHRDQNGLLAITTGPDGTCRCSICGEEIVDRDYTEEEVTAIVDQTNNVLNMIKLMYGEMPAAAASEFYMIQPLLKKLPKLMTLAIANNAKYDNINQMNRHNNVNQFATYQGVMGGVGFGAGVPYYQQPMYDPSVMNPNPMMMNAQGMPQTQQVAPGQNPFNAAYYQQQPGYTPQAQGFAYQPGMAPAQAPATQVAQPAPTTNAPAPANGDVQVNTTLKA